MVGRLIFTLFFVSMFAVVGCGSQPGKPLEISGKITKGDQAVAGAMVVFHCITEMPVKYRTVRGETGTDGQYKLENVYPGSYQVEILEAAGSAAGGAEVDPGLQQAVAGNANEEEPLTAEVAEGKTQFDFDLTSSP